MAAERASDSAPFLSDDSESEAQDETRAEPQGESLSGVSSRRSFITVLILCYINLLNYMDRFTVAEPHLVFGAITCVTGIVGVASGVQVSRALRSRTQRADPLVCAAGLLLSAPFLYLAIVTAELSTVATYIFIFLGETFLSMNWAIVADILLYVVVPTRRSTAEALQIVVSHLLGDAGSPYLIGVVSDSLRREQSFLWQFRSLQLSLLLCSFVAVIGGAFFLATALFIETDRKRAENYDPSDDEPIVVPKSGRSTRVPVSSVLI
ncbi:protein spinster homolog 1 [Boleophthalmus pectinirostris]|uniref:protein spinster homolog 1 n=1 Tax=Boleophthalmus pectinirostris TaxID=150288 RepID=UPI002432D8DD|nr:protein spinster homolog 1 [Boleophthalmus pectinirostris]